MMETKVILFSYDPSVERVCAAAMRSCYSPYPGYSLFTASTPQKALEGEKALDDERVKSLLRKALELGHHDILEHGEFTFDIQGVSRACSHQLVRHRLASFSQQSQRYVKVSKSYGFIVPPSIPGGAKVPVSVREKKLELGFEDLIDVARQMEEGYVKLGVKPEDSRYLRPNAAATNIVMSLNPRSLMHVLGLRCARDAQWEIRDISWAMFACTNVIAPTIFESLPYADKSEYLREKIAIVNKIVTDVRPLFNKTGQDELFQIPLEEVGLEHNVSAYVRKI